MSKRRIVREKGPDLVAVVHELLDLTPAERQVDIHYQTLVALDRLEDLLGEFGVSSDAAQVVPAIAILYPQLSRITEFVLAHKAGADQLAARQ